MLQYKLPIAVTTLDQQELLPAGTILTEQVAAEIAALGRLQPRVECGLLEYGTVHDDLKRLLVIPPYHDIFSDNEVDDLLARMQVVRLPLSLLKTLDYFRQNDFHTYRHSLVVFSLSLMLFDDLDPARGAMAADLLVGPSHDLGKLSVPLDILKKAGPLTAWEKQIFRFHPLAGYVLLAYYLGDHQHPAVLVARDHHERLNGSGYPHGITDFELEVKIVAACDVYDALLSPRPYRPHTYDNRTALEELTRMAQTGALTWPCVEALVACSRRGHPALDQVVVSQEVRGTPPIGACDGMIPVDEDDACPEVELKSRKHS